jgi:hypothetical protein
MANNITEQINGLVARHDVAGLYALLLEQAADQSLLIATLRYLQVLPSYWMKELFSFKAQDDQHLWLRLFMRREPGEVVAALEYDYYAAHHKKYVQDDPGNEALLTIDLLLGINFVNKNAPFFTHDDEGGAVTPISVQQFLVARSLHGSPTLYNQWFDQGRAPSLVDSAILSVPYNRPQEWTVFHVKMRRIAFWVLCRVAAKHGSRAAPALARYALLMRNKAWPGTPSLKELPGVIAQYSANTLEQLIYEFFTPDDHPLLASSSQEESAAEGLAMGPFYTEKEWRRLVYDALIKVQQEPSLDQVRPQELLLEHLEQAAVDDDGSLDFMSDDSRDMRSVLYSLVVSRL